MARPVHAGSSNTVAQERFPDRGVNHGLLIGKREVSWNFIQPYYGIRSIKLHLHAHEFMAQAESCFAEA